MEAGLSALAANAGTRVAAVQLGFARLGAGGKQPGSALRCNGVPAKHLLLNVQRAFRVGAVLGAMPAHALARMAAR